MAIAHPLDTEYLIFRMNPKHHGVLCSGRAYHFLENLDRGHHISIRHGLGKPFQYFRIPFDVASRDKDAFSRHTPQQTFVRQRVNGVANRLPGRSILIRRLIFGGQRRTFFLTRRRNTSASRWRWPLPSAWPHRWTALPHCRTGSRRSSCRPRPCCPQGVHRERCRIYGTRFRRSTDCHARPAGQ